MTYLNEKDANHAFPEWVDAEAHNSVIGCMCCQRSCPYNKGVADWYVDRGVFDEAETEYLLQGRYRGRKAAAIQRKLKAVGLELRLFPRNLEVLLGKKQL